MKKSYFLMSGLALLFLTACHQNPLKNTTPEKAARFLVQASQYAEEKQGTDLRGAVYMICMQEKILHSDCKRFLKTMVDFAQPNPDFKGLTVTDLEDKSFFESIQKTYQEKRFDAL